MQREDINTMVCFILNPLSDQEIMAQRLGNLSELDWSTLLEEAFRQGLHLLLYHRLKQTGFLSATPENIKRDLSDQYMGAAARNMKMIHHAGKILQSLRGHGVDVIVLKGLYLAEAVYPTIGMRMFGDLDLLIREGNVDRGLAVLQSLGYQLSGYYDPHDPNRDIKHLPPLVRDDAPTVELHWNILEEDAPFAIRIEDIWTRAQPAKVAGVDILAPGIEDLILHLSIHATYQHGLRWGVRPLYDIAAVMQKFSGQVLWEKLAGTAAEWGVERVLWLTLSLVTEVTGEEVPGEFLRKLINEGVDPNILKEARELIFSQEDEALNLTPDLAALGTMKTPGEKIRRVKERIFLPRRIMARQYNIDPRSPRIYGYYAVRFWELLTRYGKAGMALLKKNEGVLVEVTREEARSRLGEWLEQG